MKESQDSQDYVAIVNEEDQYSLWLTGQALPLGWREAGKRGTKQQCVDFINAVWTDMRPASLRDKMDKAKSH